MIREFVDFITLTAKGVNFQEQIGSWLASRAMLQGAGPAVSGYAHPNVLQQRINTEFVERVRLNYSTAVCCDRGVFFKLRIEAFKSPIITPFQSDR
jgi:hypothetical protein